MRERRSICLATSVAVGLLVGCGMATPYTVEMPWSSDVFGPDGPWHAVQLKIGSQNTPVSLYPGGTWASNVFTNDFCEIQTQGCPAQAAGLYDPTTSTTLQYGPPSSDPPVDFSKGALQMTGPLPLLVTDTWTIDASSGSIVAPNMDMVIHNQTWGTLPDGSTYPLSVGALSLGAPGNINESISFGNGQPVFNATLLTPYLQQEAPGNRISSSSYGLHIGSVSPSIPPSLYYGGFDQNRVLGTVSAGQGSANAPGSIDLLDISLSVNSGTSPWSFNNLGGLLATGNASIGDALPVGINSLVPYFHLPQSTCDAIAAYLPVTYQAKYGLYFWNTSDPQYQKIITSASSVSFTFRASESAGANLTINVPFALLNLTLEAPLTTNPTLYFPCKAETKAVFQLGRAFLQAAFVGGNWYANNGTGAFWLAQAPGPDIPTQANIQFIGNTDTVITGSTNDWAASWKDTWAVLAQTTQTGGSATSSSNPSSPSNNPNSPSNSPSNPSNSPGSTVPSNNSSSSSGLSVGAKAGIGVAAAIGGIALIVLGVVLWHRSRVPTVETEPLYHETKELAAPPPYPNRTPELSDSCAPTEVYGYQLESYELQAQ
jgi:hypothetical protein